MTEGRGPGPGTALTQIFADVIEALMRLMRGEIALARAEMSRAIGDLGRACAQLAIAGILALVALNVLAGAVVAGLVAAGLSPIWAQVVVGGVLALLALGFLQYGLSLLRRADLTPHRSLDNLRRDAEALTGRTGEDDYDR